MLGHVGRTIRERLTDLRFTAVGPENGKWRGVINLHDEKGRFASRLYLSDEEYDSKAQAIRAMSYLVKQARRSKR